MGNHEFCTRCHASDFHSGYTCEEAYPEKLARVQRDEQDLKIRMAEAKRRLEAVASHLRKRFEVEVDVTCEYGTTWNLKISAWQVLKTSKKIK